MGRAWGLWEERSREEAVELSVGQYTMRGWDEKPMNTEFGGLFHQTWYMAAGEDTRLMLSFVRREIAWLSSHCQCIRTSNEVQQ